MLNTLKQSVLTLSVTVISIASFAQTSTLKTVPNGWHLKDQKSSGYYGISLDKAYDFVKGKKSQTVLVAIIDSGIDTTHEDLKSVLWTNPKEIPGNGIDDDGNGYVDDIHGWNFIGGRDGRNVKEDSYEAARVYHTYKGKFENITDASMLSKADQALYETWKRAKGDVVDNVDPTQLAQAKFVYNKLKPGDSSIRADLKKEEYNGHDLQSYTPSNADAATTKKIILGICAMNNNNLDITNQQLLEEIEGEMRKAETVTAAPPNYRGDIVKDNENDINDKFYGNNDIMAGTPFHGTHVAGIIGGVRNNGKGIDGIADNVRIMMIRAVPDGDEHDKDIALAIRYAVDNGARVINMSFGKSYSPQKQWVDDAVKYAESKGVLLVHAAGNDAKNLDSDYNFPTPKLLDGTKPTNFLTIGASGDPGNGGLAANFSNYGKKEVDVFAPGVNIYSTIPGGNTYGNASGTSMASPVTAGVAAFLLEYYPKLTPQQLKTVLEKSSVKPTVKATKPGTDEEVSLSELSRSGGLINAYEAAKLAQQMTSQKAPVKQMKVKQAKRA
ncbi:MAG TPA: S8 family peptidase [Flavisolibacter sp.]|nr:S8 family peptidase [Flavisolibacter sp.]